MGLTSTEKEKIKRVIPKSSQKVLDAAIARLYVAYPDPQQWTYTGLSGAIVLVDDLVGHTFFLKLVDVNGHRGVLWDQELYVDFQYNQDRSFFHSFELEECLAGLLFDDTSDSSHFHKRVVNREKHGSKKTVQNKQAIALKKNPEVKAPGPRGELNTTAIGEQRIRKTTHMLYYDDQPPPEWRTLYKELANAGITEDMIADNKDFIKDYIRQQGGPLVGLEPPIPRKYQHGKQDMLSFPMSSTPSMRKKAPPPPPPTTMYSESVSSPSELTRENTPDISPLLTESSSMEQTPDPDLQFEARGPVHRVPPPLETSVHRVPPPLEAPVHRVPPPSYNSIPPPPSTQPVRPNPPPLPQQSRPTPPLPTQTRPIPAPPNRSNGPPPSTRGNVPPPPLSRGPIPQPPPRTMAQQLSQVQGRAPPPAPPPRRGPAPPAPPTRASRTVPPPPPSRQPQAVQYQQQQQPQYSQQHHQEAQKFTPAPPLLPRSNAVPAAPQFPQAAQNVPPPPPLPTQSDVPPPPPLPTQSNVPPPPPLPTQSNVPPPPPLTMGKVLGSEQMGEPANTPPPPTVDGGRDALLASIRGAGLSSLKKVDKSQLDRPSVLLQEQRGEAPPPSAGGVAPGGTTGGSLADALAAALNQRKAKVSHSDDDSDGEEW